MPANHNCTYSLHALCRRVLKKLKETIFTIGQILEQNPCYGVNKFDNVRTSLFAHYDYKHILHAFCCWVFFSQGNNTLLLYDHHDHATILIEPSLHIITI